jgi:crotonobetainyl-CoA:carnitine CoA-transferase CaiB-like acyl-CoA transferase
VRFSGCDTAFRFHPPRLGADGREVLTEIGLGADDVEALLREGALVLPEASSEQDESP